MNRKNKMLVGCLALLLALSVGYALFSETITINGTATAKGSFDLVATCQTGYLDKLGTPSLHGFTKDKDGGYVNDSCSVVGDEVLLNTDFLYPSASRYFTVKITNNGTIAAGFKMKDVIYNKELCVADNIEGNNKNCSTTNLIYSVPMVSGYVGRIQWYIVAIEGPNGNLLSQSELVEYWNPVNEEGFINPGYSIYVVTFLTIDHDYDQSSGEMYAKYTISYTLPFTQYTE